MQEYNWHTKTLYSRGWGYGKRGVWMVNRFLIFCCLGREKKDEGTFIE